MSAASRFVDRLLVNAPYDGVLAVAYDTWLPPGVRFPDDAFHADIVRACVGPSLELGVGTGRFLVPLVEEGRPLEGVDNSADMSTVAGVMRRPATSRSACTTVTSRRWPSGDATVHWCARRGASH